jgi:hypothetical protein
MPKKSVVNAPNKLGKFKDVFDLEVEDIASIFGVSTSTVARWLKDPKPTLHMRPKNARLLFAIGGLLLYIGLVLRSKDAPLWFWIPIILLDDRTPYQIIKDGDIGRLNCYLDNLLVDEGEEPGLVL